MSLSVYSADPAVALSRTAVVSVVIGFESFG
jgi:hypothetical protein